MAVEHWDNLQHKAGSANPSGHTMIDGPAEVTDFDKTEVNRELVRSFVEEVLINGQFEKLEQYIDAEGYTEHNPHMSDGLPALRSALTVTASNGKRMIQYNRMHRILAEGNFSLCVSEGFRNGVYSSFYDLLRVADGKLVEHWDTTAAILLEDEGNFIDHSKSSAFIVREHEL